MKTAYTLAAVFDADALTPARVAAALSRDAPPARRWAERHGGLAALAEAVVACLPDAFAIPMPASPAHETSRRWRQQIEFGGDDGRVAGRLALCIELRLLAEAGGSWRCALALGFEEGPSFFMSRRRVRLPEVAEAGA